MADRKITWNTTFDAVRSFVAANNCYPSTTSTNPSEKSLAQWWSRQKFLLRNNKLDDERKSIVEGLMMQNESLERDGVWLTRYNNLVNKYKIDGKLFSTKSENAEEQLTMRWWNQQKTFARKFQNDKSSTAGGMTQDRFDKVIALMRIMNKELVKNETLAPK